MRQFAENATRILFIALGIALSAACADTATSPDVISPSSSPSQIVVSWPGGGGKCDPWIDINWCEGDSGGCATSQPPASDAEEAAGVQSCLPPGGGGGGGSPSPRPEPEDTCNTGNPLLEEGAVQAGLQSMWQQSGIEKPQAQRLEMAAWIVRNPDGSHQVLPLSGAVSTPCSVNGNWNAPPGTVAFVHTHPFSSGETMLACGPIARELPNGTSIPIRGKNGELLYHTYGNRPSPADRDLLGNVVNDVRKRQGKPALPGYVIDNERITRYSGTNDLKDQPYNRCGY